MMNNLFFFSRKLNRIQYFLRVKNDDIFLIVTKIKIIIVALYFGHT